MMDGFVYGLTAVLVAIGLLSVACMFVAAGILFWRQTAEVVRERRKADEEIKQLGRRLSSPSR